MDRFRKENQEEPEIVKVRFSDVQKWIEAEFSEKFNRAKSRAEGIHKNIQEGFQEIKKSNQNLDRASFESEDKTYAAVNMIKDSFVKRTHSLILGIERLTNNIEYSSLKEFYSSSDNVIKEMKKTNPKQAILLSRFFKKEGGALIENIVRAEKTVKSLQEFLDSEGKIMDLFQGANLIEQERLRLLENLDSLERQEHELGERRKETLKERGVIESGLSELKLSKEWKEMETLERELEKLEEEKSNIEEEIRSRLLIANRPFKKMKHSLDEKSPEIGFIKEFLHDPLGAILSENSMNQLRSLLEKTRRDNKIGLKQKDVEKLKSLQNTLESGMLELTENYRKTITKISKIGESLSMLSGLGQERKELEDKLISLSGEIKKIDNEMEKIKGDRGDINRDIINKRGEIQSLIFNRTGRKVEIC